MSEATSPQPESHAGCCMPRQSLEINLSYFADRLDQIEHRLAQLDDEPTLEQGLQTFAGVLAAAGAVGGLFSRKGSMLSACAACLLLRSSLLREEWPIVTLLRQVGMRSSRDIEQERCGLRALRGDFKGLEAKSISSESRAATAARAVRGETPAAT